MLQSKTRWNIIQNDDQKVQALSKELGISPLVARLLVNRQIDTVAEARSFLNVNAEEFHDPFLLDSMDITIKRIETAIQNEEKILVFGDYDADGVSSTTVMLRALREKGANADFYIPNRFTEGYGPNENAFRWAKSEGFTLIITVDTGISAVNEAKMAKEIGLDLIITDHHEPPPELPDAYSIIHPRKPGGNYPFGELAGVGVAFKVAHALLGSLPTHLLQFAVIGTIADLVPLKDENRLISKLGLKALQNTSNLGIRALLSISGMEDKEINEETIGFTIGPRINAVGRLESADPAVELLMTSSAEEAQMIAQEIDAINRDRQQIVSAITEEAILDVEVNYPPEKNKVLVLAKEGWNAGVIGIVASRLVEKYYRPTIVLSIDREKGLAKGSARSIEGFDLFENLSKCRDILPHFGGHTMAAGMTLELEDVEDLRSRLNQLADEVLTEEDFIPLTHVELNCSLAEISLATIEEMGLLAPFGVGNPKPLVCLEDISLKQMRKIGSQMNHLKLIFEEDGHHLDGIGFGCGHLADEISPLSQVSVIGELSINEWNGLRKPQFMIKDAAVNSWQLFDCRGNKDIKKQLDTMDQEKLVVVAFHEQTIARLNLNDRKDRIKLLVDDEAIKSIKVLNHHLVLLDLPNEKKRLKQLFIQAMPDRIYAIFDHNEDHFFSTLPTRDHFKWFYSFLLKQQTFNVKQYADALSKKKGWSKETIHFMTKVFLELEFVTINNSVISLIEKPKKRDFTESRTYKLKQELLQMENELVYSSYQSLKDWFDGISSFSRKHEEEVF
ncbi:single-stranded-DNA-specific exonuclease RecJ [Bacillus sp. Marseille-P3661]|uniref:single-stranded-DNA-specific exonuclease RecJ n=1 Tax=Bacillus sp. Marseille-P3661 TaxID=1936234 RepID=UPI000C85C600|nr:single-stranded-DNA-specific exonuclease RecJ [Bacillus sp. Marseille-P3661]